MNVVDDHVVDDSVAILPDHLHVRIDSVDHFHNYDCYEMFENENGHGRRVDSLLRTNAPVGQHLSPLPDQMFEQFADLCYQHWIYNRKCILSRQ